MNTNETPRTDEACRAEFDGRRSQYVVADFARQLERELITATQERDELRAELTEAQLKQALAKMLPEKLIFYSPSRLYWKAAHAPWPSDEVRDTELLHTCWLVEDGLIDDDDQEADQRTRYSKELMKLCGVWRSEDWGWGDVCNADLFSAAHATWQHRTIALAKVKGVEII